MSRFFCLPQTTLILSIYDLTIYYLFDYWDIGVFQKRKSAAINEICGKQKGLTHRSAPTKNYKNIDDKRYLTPFPL